MIECKSTNERYCCKTDFGNFSIQADTSSDKGGVENGISPHDILATAFASCLNMTVRMVCEKKNIPMNDVTTRVSLIREADKTTFAYNVEFGEYIDEDRKNELLEVVKKCPIRKTLSKQIEFVMQEDIFSLENDLNSCSFVPRK